MGKFKDWIEKHLNWLDTNMPRDANGPLGIQSGHE